MRVLTDGWGLDGFWKSVREARYRLLLLDYDGTLAPFVEDRDRATPYEGAAEILRALMALDSCRLVIVSGRPARNMAGMIGLDPSPEIWGCHGGERLFPDGRYEIETLDLTVQRELDWIEERMAKTAGPKRVERKPFGLALHYRGLPPQQADEMDREVRGFLEKSREVVQGRLVLKSFDGGIELRPLGITKARAVEELLNETPSPRTAAYLGDDATDEDAFNALKGKGLSVLVGKEYRPTRADLWLTPPEELIDFLTKWKESCEANRRERAIE